MGDDYTSERRDGARLARPVRAGEDANWAALLGESRF